VRFYRTSGGREPVKEWLHGLELGARRAIGNDLRTVQYGWPLGMPLVRSLGDGLWELRSSIPQGIARVIFLVSDDILVPLSGFIKKTGRIPKRELSLARKRAADLRGKR
jgi:phage-related protein